MRTLRSRAAGARTRGAQGRHLPLLRPRRLHRPRRDAWTPRTCARCSSPTTRACAASSSASAARSRSSSATRSWRVFGAPVAHEDDPERAVRAALAIRDALAEEGELEVRIGITTGEALIALDARPEAGEGMASGDVVNTAARLQAAAPTGRRSSSTRRRIARRSARSSIERGRAGRGEGKGGAGAGLEGGAGASSRRRRARRRRARSSGASGSSTLLRETLRRGRRASSEPQLVTLVGVPGIGKSRLVFELFQTIETGAYGLVYWRQRPLAALRRGRDVLGARRRWSRRRRESSRRTTPRTAEAKLRAGGRRRVVDDAADADWVERHLRPLVGPRDRRRLAADRRGEAFAAWRRFFEALAEERPLVLVFEDLHWADDALLDFVDYLVEWARGVPLLVALHRAPRAARRAGRLGRRQGELVDDPALAALGGGDRDARVALARARRRCRAELAGRLLEHAAGNPLYAEEFARMLAERAVPEADLPETVQGIIAARLDTLPPEEKELLQDAAVLGQGRSGSARSARERRSARGAVCTRSSGRSSSAASGAVGRAARVEYAFRHALVRDVAYEQIPRAERAREAPRGRRVDRVARARRGPCGDCSRYHYLAALELARATGAGRRAPRRARACRPARDAGDRRSPSARSRRRRASTSGRSSSRPATRPAELLLRYGRALAVSGGRPRGAGARAAAEALLEAGDPRPPQRRSRPDGGVPVRGSPRRGLRPQRAGSSSSC